MLVREGQKTGALALLVASLAVYLGGGLIRCRPPQSSFLPWGDQRKGMIAAAVSDTPHADGIYFLPAGTTIREMSKIAGRAVGGAQDRLLASSSFDASAVALAAKGDGLEVGDMPAVARLALGFRIDLNSAGEEELLLVPGIGESLARAIVQLREQKGRFHALEELKVIPGIKEGKLRGLGKYLAVASGS